MPSRAHDLEWHSYGVESREQNQTHVCDHRYGVADGTGGQ